MAGVGVAMLGLAGGIAMADGDVPSGNTFPDVETPGHADEAAHPAATAHPSLPTEKREKLDGSLAAVADAAAMSGEAAALTIAQANGLTTERGAVRVLVETDNPDLAPARAAIVAAGGTVEGDAAPRAGCGSGLRAAGAVAADRPPP